MKEKYIMTVWRVSKKQQQWVKKEAKRGKCSEAEIVRSLITSKMIDQKEY